MDAWIALDRESLDLAIQAMFPTRELRPARAPYREARAAWRGQKGKETSWMTQYASLGITLPQVRFEDLGVIAFSNYVLGFGRVRSDLTLQGATSLAKVLKELDLDLLEVRATPVVVERSLGGEVWRVDASEVEPLHQSLVLGITPPETGKLASRRTRAARVLVIAPLSRRSATRYAAEVRRRLNASAGSPVEVTLVSGLDDGLASRAAEELDRRPALAVLVAPPRPETAAAEDLVKVYTMLRKRGQEAVVTTPLPARGEAVDSGAQEALETAVTESRLPVSTTPDVVPTESLEEQAAGAEAEESPVTDMAEESPVTNMAEELTAAARAHVQTLVRACWPGTFAPKLKSTRLGFSFVAARHTGVAVVGVSDEAAAALQRRLRLSGFPAERMSAEEAGATPAVAGTLVWYRPGSRAAALSLADDLGLPKGNVVRIDDIPRKILVRTSR